MDIKEFQDMMYERYKGKYGMMPPPISDKEGLDILIKHFIGDYYSVNPISREQFNTEAICRILEEYPIYKNKKDKIIKKIKQFFCQIGV